MVLNATQGGPVIMRIVFIWGRNWVKNKMPHCETPHKYCFSNFVSREYEQTCKEHGVPWVLDPVAASKLDCWHSLARTLHAEQLGQFPLLAGQRLASAGLVLQPIGSSGRRFVLQAGHRRVSLQRSQLRLQP